MTPAAAFIAVRARMSSVASASTQQVASGISRRLRESLSAMAPRTPLSGTRIPVPWAAMGAGAGVPGASGSAGCSAVRTWASAARSAYSTSARRISPSGPEPVISFRSRPFCRASLRTSGEITGTGPSGTTGAPACPFASARAAGSACPGRTLRRRAGASDVPYPTSTLPEPSVSRPVGDAPTATVISGAPTGSSAPSSPKRAVTTPP